MSSQKRPRTMDASTKSEHFGCPMFSAVAVRTQRASACSPSRADGLAHRLNRRRESQQRRIQIAHQPIAQRRVASNEFFYQWEDLISDAETAWKSRSFGALIGRDLPHPHVFRMPEKVSLKQREPGLDRIFIFLPRIDVLRHHLASFTGMSGSDLRAFLRSALARIHF